MVLLSSSSQMHREAEGQKWAADCSSGAKEGRVRADECLSEQTGGRLLRSAGGSQIQVRTRSPTPDTQTQDTTSCAVLGSNELHVTSICNLIMN